MRQGPLLGILMLAFGCSLEPPDTDGEGTWVGTIVTEGSVTTVVNQSGSVWDGAARLVEEASIGVEAGAEEYMLGGVAGTWMSDERIYVIDYQVPAVRVYDFDGTFVRNLGGEGQGPGEFMAPQLVAVDAEGRVFVLDHGLGRINVYGAGGEPVDTWPFPSPRCCAWRMFPLTSDALWAPARQGGITDSGVQAVGPDGPFGDYTWVPEVEYERSTYVGLEGFEPATPFSAALVWNPAPEGKVVFGASDRYRFEVRTPDGRSLVVERYWEPVAVPAEHGDWERRREVAFQRRLDPEFAWDGEGMPDHKPAFWSLLPSLSGEVWVMRPGASRRLGDCAEDPIAEGHPAGSRRPCWADDVIVDAFAADGRYLGEVDLPDDALAGPHAVFVDGGRVLAVVSDEADTIMVKRYRLVLPGQQ